MEKQQVAGGVLLVRRGAAQGGGGVLRLPPGFRFHPTDEELVVQYLRRKVFSFPLPAAIIPDIELSRFDPWDLPGSPERERYFFNMRQAKYPNGSRPNRATVSGYWKATGKDRSITASRCCGGGDSNNNQQTVVGMKKVLVFYRGKPPRGPRTDWIMHEYRLAGAAATGAQFCISPLRKNSTHSSKVVQTEDWVLCRIFRKRRRVVKNDGEQMEESSCEDEVGGEHGNDGFIDFINMGGRGGGSSSSSSGPSSPHSDSEELSCVTSEVSADHGSSSGDQDSCVCFSLSLAHKC